ncbi:MAG: 16S rRNA (guanine(966)-N(2))-methyltransferase RsmD [Polyangiaceae bacterium]
MRITGGVFRSRAIRAPRGDATRPTSDRVREALFSMLSSEREIDGARVLDLYSGTGALAFEAISRGAVHASLVEKNKQALTSIGENVEALGLKSSVRVHAMQVEKVAPLLGSEPFDLIFADPPYADVPSGVLLRALEPVFRGAKFSSDALFMLEHASRDDLPVMTSLVPNTGGSIELRKHRIYGDTAIAIFGILGGE